MSVGENLVWRWLEQLRGPTDYLRRQGWEGLLKPDDLGEACRDAVLASEPALLDRAWACATGSPEVLADLKMLCASDLFLARTREEAPDDAAQRLYGALVGTIGAAQAALAVGHPERFRLWLQRTAAAWGADEALLTCQEPLTRAEGEPGELVADRYFQVLRRAVEGPLPLGAARDAVRAMLQKPRRILRRQATPLLCYHKPRGVVAWLHVESIADGCGEFYAHPARMGLVPMTTSFQRGVATAWQLARRLVPEAAATDDVRWHLLLPSEESAPLDGGSLGAALVVALVQLLRGDPLDPCCALTAAVTTQGQLEPVAHVREKVRTALARSEIARVIVHPRNQAAAQDAAVVARGPDGAAAISSAATVDEACLQASGLITGLRDYLQRLSQLPDRPERQPAYLGQGRQLRQLHVSPEVWKRAPGAEQPSDTGSNPLDLEAARPRLRRETPVPEVEDVGEDPLYDEELSETTERVAWRDEWQATLRNDTAWRAVVLGAPGQGKSLLLETTAAELAQQASDRLNRQELRPEQVPLPLLVSLPDLVLRGPGADESPEQALRRALAEDLDRQGCPSAIVGHLAAHAHETRSWWFLDGLDEVQDRETLGRFLTVLSQWPCRLIVSSRPAGLEGRWLPPDLCVYRLAPFAPAQVLQFIQNWFPAGKARDRLLELLGRNASVQQVSQNPFLLTLICAIIEQGRFGAESTRGQLHERALSLVLGGNERADEWLPLLQELAWTLCNRSPRRPRITGKELLDFICARPEHRPRVRGGPRSLRSREKAAHLRDELCRNRFLVPLAGERDYVFPHRSFAEFLAAAHLADVIQRDGWSRATAALDGQLVFVGDWLARNSWHPDWEQVILLLAGRLADPGPLLQLLGNEDDLFHHRLGLAGQCLGELSPTARSRIGVLLDQVTTAVLKSWTIHEEQGTTAAVESLTRALPALALAGGRVDGIPLGEWLIGQLEDPRRRPLALAALEEMGAVLLPRLGSAGKELLERLAELLREEQSYARWLVVWAVGGLGGAAAQPEFLGQLGQILGHPDWHVRRAAAAAVGRIGIAAGQSERILEALTLLLRDTEGEVRSAAAEAVGRLGLPAARDSALNPLAALLHDPERKVRQAAAQALGELSGCNATQTVFQRLAEQLADPSWEVRRQAAWAVGRLGKAAAQAEFLTGLARLLQRDPHWKVRQAAAEAAGGLGNAVTEPILRGLLDLLAHPEQEVRRAAVWALGHLGNSAARADFCERLLEELDDPDSLVRAGAAWALGSFGGVAAQSRILEKLDPLLGHEDREIRARAAWAVGQLAGWPATAAYPDRLVSLLDGGQHSVKLAAAWATASMGARGDRPGLHPPLLRLLRDPDPEMALAAVTALGSLGGAAPPEVLEQFARLLRAGDHTMLRAVVKAVTALHPLTDGPFLDQLAALLGHSDAARRRAALEIIGTLGDTVVQRMDILVLLQERLGEEEERRHGIAITELTAQGSAVRWKTTARTLQRLMARGVRLFRDTAGQRVARTVDDLSR